MMAQNDLVVAGIDVAKDKVDVCIRSLSLKRAFASTAEGRRELASWLRRQKVGKGSAFRTALALSGEIGAPQVSALLPGAYEAALRIAVGHGMRITFPMLLMSTCNFGDWSAHLPRSPGFM